jgi:hypothetical protein
MITASISRDRIDKSLLVTKGDKTYLNVVFFENTNQATGQCEPDKFGNDGIIKQALSKEQRAEGVKAPIVGNWKWMKQQSGKAQQAPAPAPKQDDSDDVPF